MKFLTASKYPTKLDALILHITEGDSRLPTETAAVDKLLKGSIRDELKELKTKGRPGDVVVLRTTRGVPAKRIIVVGVGKRPVELDRIRQATAAAVRQARSLHLRSLATPANGGQRLAAEKVAAAIAEGARLTDYHFGKYQQSQENRQPITFTLVGSHHAAAARRGLTRGSLEAEAAILARDLVNEPPSVMHPRQLAAVAKGLAKTGLKVQVLGRQQMAKLGLHATLAVASGSDEPPQFIRLQYSPTKARRHVVLVGKGVTFDSGGINLKPSQGGSLEEMKMDMAGAAAVIATMSALPKLKLPVKVTAYVAAVENLLGGSAYKPGDIVKTYSGKTIEVGNTDAEGRLTLADALSYAVKREKPDAIIDLATLTGAVIVALGKRYAGLFSNRPDLADELRAAGRQTGEKLWELPLPEEYNELIKSPVAELHNTGGGHGGGAITAALLLQHFVGKTPWAHLDIAGTAWADKDAGYLKRGGTGYGVRLLLDYLRR